VPDIEDYHRVRLLRGESEDADHATDGVVAFIAALSQIDGLVLLGPDLTVLGFGAEITAKRDPTPREMLVGP
jgi:hypothetical protein